jgi:hypothetical protein
MWCIAIKYFGYYPDAAILQVFPEPEGFVYKVDSLLFRQDVLYTQDPTLRDLGKGW